MNRKLLPYERGLCQQLGVTEEEYLLFLSAQRDLSLSQAERLETLRGDPVSIVIAVVGVIFQVASALLAPKPEVNQDKKYQRQLRDKTYAPRAGFNGTQELARYGDPINLVYCNQAINPLGAVRVNTALLWSSVESTGTGQFMQLLLLVGAAGVRKVEYNKTAFGQLPASQFSASNTWMYYTEQAGPVRYSNKVWGDDRDPSAEKGGAITHMVSGLVSNPQEGYSQAYTPTTMKDLGLYSPIPINVEVLERDDKGKVREAEIGIEILQGFQSYYSVGNRFTLKFRQVDRQQNEDDWAVAKEAAKDLRLQLVNNLDRGAIYHLGSASFKLRWIDDDHSLNTKGITAEFECTEQGYGPTTKYDRLQARSYNKAQKEEYDHALDVLSAPVKDNVVELTVNDVLSTGMVDPEKASRHVYWIGMSGRQKKDRKQSSSLFEDDIYIKKFGAGGATESNKDYSFVGEQKLTWINDLDKNSEITYPKGGSIAYSEKILEAFLADKPKIRTDLLRKEYQSDLRKLRRLRDQLTSGKLRKCIRAYIIATDPEAQSLRAQIKNLNNLIAAANGEEMDDVWREEAKQQPTAVSLRQQIANKREEIESYADNEEGGRAVKRVKRLENQIENLRDDRRDFISKYIAQKRRQAKVPNWQIREWRDQKDDLRTRIQDIVAEKLDDARDDLLTLVRESETAFVLPHQCSNERFACGINCLREKIDNLRGDWTTDQVGTKRVRDSLRELIAEKQKARQWLQYIVKNWHTLVRDLDDAFYVKCLAKRSRADYCTVTSCNHVRFNFRVRLFRRISGRQKEYGEHKAPDGYKLSDNGLERRTMFFQMLVKDLGAPDWTRVPKIFAVERGNDADHYITLMFLGSKGKREFRFVPILDPAAEVKEFGFNGYAYIYNGGTVRRIDFGQGSVEFYGRLIDLDTNKFPDLKERGPMYTNEWDMFSVHSDTQVQASYDNGPEASLVNVTEQTTCNLDAQKYKDMSLMAFHTYASQGVDDLRSISAYVVEGKTSWKVNDSNGQPYASGGGACYAPDIFTDTVMDATNGIKNFANANAVDWERLALAKRFCKNNGLGCQLFMDGVIADQRGWRDFWVEVAPFSLLEFARMNGKETLIPALPTDAAGVATRQLTISALFNEGNILEDSYREEYLDYGDTTKDLVATVVYREIKANDVFPRNMSVTLCRSDTDTNDAIWQTFDLSDWVSQKRQAELYGRFLCQQRRYIGRTIEFKTVPTDSPVQPGAYIYVDIGLKRWDTVRTGIVREGGVLDLPLEVGIADGTYTVMTYSSGSQPVTHTSITIQDGVAAGLNASEGSLFVLGNSSDSRRVFRVTEVSLDEEAVITVRGVEHPCVINGASATSLVADLSDGLFKEIGVNCD
jgi:hypothetical protein